MLVDIFGYTLVPGTCIILNDIIQNFNFNFNFVSLIYSNKQCDGSESAHWIRIRIRIYWDDYFNIFFIHMLATAKTGIATKSTVYFMNEFDCVRLTSNTIVLHLYKYFSDIYFS